MNESDDPAFRKLADELTHRGTFAYVVEILFTIGIVVSSMGGNILVLLAAYRKPDLRGKMYMYIIALTAGDTLLSSQCLIFLYTVISGNGGYSYSFCVFWVVLNFFPGGCSLIFMCLMAVQRYLKTMKPSLYQRIYKTRNVLASVVATWTYVAIYVVCTLITGKVEFHPGYAICTYDLSTLDLPTLICVFLSAFLPMVIAYFCYFKIWRYIRQHNQDMAQSRVSAKEIKATRILFLIVFSYTVLSAPYIIVSALESHFGTAVIPRKVYFTCSILYGYSYAANPVIYAWLNTQFRQEFLKILRMPCCRWHSATVAPANIDKENAINPAGARDIDDQGQAKTRSQGRYLVRQHVKVAPGNVNQQNDIQPGAAEPGGWVASENIKGQQNVQHIYDGDAQQSTPEDL